MRTLVLATLLIIAHASSGAEPSPAIDGVLGPEEWRGARHVNLEGGVEAWLLRRGNDLFVAMKATKPGFPTICTGTAKRVELLHASAALGTAIYEREGDSWRLRQNFTWSVRDSPRLGSPTAAQKEAFLQSAGWLGNSSNAGSPVREFLIRLNPDRQRFGLAFLHTDEPMTAAWAPIRMNDDCRAIRLLQGFLPELAQFAPSAWIDVK